MITLEIHDPRPGEVSERYILVDGGREVAEQLATAARTTPDQILSEP